MALITSKKGALMTKSWLVYEREGSGESNRYIGITNTKLVALCIQANTPEEAAQIAIQDCDVGDPSVGKPIYLTVVPLDIKDGIDITATTHIVISRSPEKKDDEKR